MIPLEAPARTLRAAIYCRVSTAGQAEEGYSLDGQLQECRALAAELGSSIVAEYQETGSGADWDLPHLLDLLERARRGDFDLLLCYATSRLARELGKLLVVERELKRSGVTVRYVTQAHDDSPQGRLTRNIFGAFDEFERENIALRFALGKRAKAARGLVVGGNPAPFGYRHVVDQRGRAVGLEIDPAAAPIVRRIVAELAEQPITAVCDLLNAAGVPTPGKAERWAPSTVSDMLRNPVYLGRYYYGRFAYTQRHKTRTRQLRDLADAPSIAVPALFGEDELRAALNGLAERKVRHAARRHRAAEDPYTLRGLLNCSRCGGPLACLPNGSKNVRYYACLRGYPGRARLQGRAHCPLSAVPAAGLEAHAWEFIRSTLLDPDYLRIGLEEARKANKLAERRSQQLADLRAEIEQRRKNAERLVEDWLAHEPGGVVAHALKAKAAQLEAEVKSLLAQLQDLESRPVPGLSEDDARALEQFAGKIRVGIDKATPADQHRIYRLLRLRGRAFEAADGLKLGRANCSRRFAFEWEAIFQLRNEGRLVEAGRVRPIVGRSLPIEQANEALDELRSAPPSGRLVLIL